MRSDRAKAIGWLNDIRSHIDLVQGFVAGLDSETFRADMLRFLAVTRCLEIISEASRRLPDDLKERHPAILWREMAGAGNIYRHEYEDVAPIDIWTTVQDHLPALRAVVENELAALAP
jgi:uncharacterized protein with HEPN domain